MEITDRVLTEAQSSREVIQDFVPLADSFEWDLGQQYLRQRGNKAFISDFSAVPYVINNDGTLSRHAAEIFVASLQEADKAGTLPAEIHVLELGVGVGLFARYFLDQVQELSRRAKKDPAAHLHRRRPLRGYAVGRAASRRAGQSPVALPRAPGRCHWSATGSGHTTTVGKNVFKKIRTKSSTGLKYVPWPAMIVVH